MLKLDVLAAELNLWANETEQIYRATKESKYRGDAKHLRYLAATLNQSSLPSTGVTSFNTRVGDVVLSSLDVTTALGYNPVTQARTLTINGVTYDLSANRSWTISTAIPTLAQVTTAGNTTTNAITVGKTTVIHTPSNGDYIFRAESTQNRLELIHPGSGGATLQMTSTLNSGYTKEFIMTGKFKISTEYFGNAVYFGNSSTTYTIFTNTNNFAIGTTTDAGYKLDVNGSTRLNSSATVSSDLSVGLTAAFGRFNVRGADNLSSSRAITVQNQSQTLIFDLYNDGKTLLNPQGTGNVLIGTTTDAGYKLDVNGTARIQGNTEISRTGADTQLTVARGGGASFTIQGKANSTSQSEGVNLYWTNNTWLKFVLGSSVVANFSNVGNLLVGTSTDAGYKLDVNGVTRVSGTGTFNGQDAFVVRSSAQFIFRVNNDENIIIGRGGGQETYISAVNSGRLLIQNGVGASQTLTGGIQIGTLANYTQGTGTQVFTIINPVFNPTGFSDANFSAFVIAPTINQSANPSTVGLSRGLYINPTLVSPKDFRAIETTVGKVIHQGLTNATHTNQVYYNTTTGELTYGALPTPATPTLDQVVTAGNSVSNNGITITRASGATLTLNPGPSDNAIVINNSGFIRFTGAGIDSFIRGNSTVFSVLDAGFVSKVQFHWGGSASYINTGGNFLIGTTTDAGYKLDVNGTGRFINTLNLDSNLTFGANDITINSTKVFGKLSIYGTASAVAAIAIGYNSTASNNSSVSIGYNSQNSGDRAVTIGADTSSNATNSVTIGRGSVGATDSFVSGSNLGTIADVYFGSGVRHASANTAGADYRINGSGASNNFNIAGGNIIIAGGKGTGTGTPGDVIFATSSLLGSSLTLQSLTNRVWIKGDSGNVGIGTTSPFGKVDVKDGEIFVTTSTNANLRSRLTYQGLYVSRASDGTYPEQIISVSSAWEYHTRNNHVFYRDGSPYFQIGTTGTASYLTINTTGNVLIGTTTDAGVKLDVVGSIRASSILFGSQITNTNSNPVIGSDGSNIALGVNFASRIIMAGTNIDLQANSVSIARFASSNAGVYIGGAITPTAKLQVAGSITAASALAQGVYFNNTLVAAANNDVLVGLDINPTFTNGAFTGVTNYAIRTIGDVRFQLAGYPLYGLNITNTLTGHTYISKTGASTNLYIEGPQGVNISPIGNVSIGSIIQAGNKFSVFTNTGTSPPSLGSWGGTFSVVVGGNNGQFGLLAGVVHTTGDAWFQAQRVDALATAYNILLQPTGGNVLIGTYINAGYKLDINGIARVGDSGGSGQLYIKGFAGTGQYLYLDDGSKVWSLVGSTNYSIQENGTSRLIVKEGGNVGIGTTNPTDKLQVAGNVRFGTGAVGTLFFWDNVNGRLGIGNTTPSYKLEVNGGAFFNENIIIANGDGIKFWVDKVRIAPATIDSLGFYTGTTAGSPLEQMRIVSNGNVLIGTTTDNGNKLNVNGDVSAQAYKVNNVLGFTGIFNVPTNPPGQQNLDIQGGIVVNVF